MILSRLKWLLGGAVAGVALYAFIPAHVVWDPAGMSSQPAADANLGSRAQLPDFTALVERVGPSVVNVTTRSRAPNPVDVADRHFDIYQGLTGAPRAHPHATLIGIGSGLILDNDGYVLTNAHVIDGAEEVYVRLHGKRGELRAKVVGADTTTDIALLKVHATRLPVARTGSSAALKVGDWVAAIGSPFGFEHTITAGIISAKERRLPHSAQMPFLQSDVAINPGSSGGPLVNLRGEVVGVNSKIYTRTGGYMGVSFAIPIETALKVSSELRRRGHVARGFLGLETQAINEALAASFGLDEMHGALVTGVAPDSPAGRAGVHPGDIVLSYAGKVVERPDELARAIEETPPGTRTELMLWRRNERVTTSAVIEGSTQNSSAYGNAIPFAFERFIGTGALDLTELPSEQCRSLRIDFGLMVHDFAGAPDSGLEPGDVIVGVNAQRFATRAEFDRLLSEQRRGDVPPALLIVRAGRSLYVPFESAHP